MYFLPIQDEAPSSSVKCVLKKDSKKSQVAKTKQLQKYDHSVTFAIAFRFQNGQKAMVQWMLQGQDYYRYLHLICMHTFTFQCYHGVVSLVYVQEGANSESDHTTDTSSPDLVAPVLTTKKKVQQNIVFKVKRFGQNLWTAIFKIAFIFTVVAMMVCWVCVCYCDRIYCQTCSSNIYFC